MFQVRALTLPLLLTITLLAFSAAAAPSKQPIAQLKAAYIYNIAKFTRWPSATWGAEDAPFNLCVYGDNDVAVELKSIIGKLIEHHPVRVIYPTSEYEFNQCQTLYVSPSERKRYRYVLGLINTHKLLTISDDDDFIASGGLINLRQVEKRLRFEINMNQLALSDFTLSSKLLKIAIRQNISEAQE